MLGQDLHVIALGPLSGFRLIRINEHSVTTMAEVSTVWKNRNCTHCPTRCVFMRVAEPPTVTKPLLSRPDSIGTHATRTASLTDSIMSEAGPDDGPSSEDPMHVSFTTTGNVLTGADHTNLIRAGLTRLASEDEKTYVSPVFYNRDLIKEYNNPLLFYAFTPACWTLARGGPELPAVDCTLSETLQEAIV